jgi:hypothetical protein
MGKMPQDPNLYGQRPAKRQKKEIPLSSSLAFTSQLTSLLSASSSVASVPSVSASASSGRVRPSKAKDDLFHTKAKRKAHSKDATTSKDDGARLVLKDVHGTEEEKQDFARARRKMGEKARLYAAMKRGDYIAKEGETAPLVDFDAKWAQSHPEGQDQYSSSGTDDSEDEGSAEIVEYKDEFGRTRKGTRADYLRQQRREQRKLMGEEELDRMSARPKAPETLIYGDAIQSHAFNPQGETWDKMEELAAKRDKSPTPPDDLHYDGNQEIRTKGVGFYQFSKDNEVRATEMEGLKKEREATQRVRRERVLDKERRRKDIEERRQKLGAKRAEKLADNFLQGLAGELLDHDGGKSQEKEPSTTKPA